MKKFFLLIIYLFLQSAFLSFQSFAQCAMCQAVAKSNLDSHSNQVGLGLNKGILYLLVLPYIFVLIGGIIWYKYRKQKTDKLAS